MKKCSRSSKTTNLSLTTKNKHSTEYSLPTKILWILNESASKKKGLGKEVNPTLRIPWLRSTTQPRQFILFRISVKRGTDSQGLLWSCFDININIISILIFWKIYFLKVYYFKFSLQKMLTLRYFKNNQILNWDMIVSSIWHYYGRVALVLRPAISVIVASH